MLLPRVGQYVHYISKYTTTRWQGVVKYCDSRFILIYVRHETFGKSFTDPKIFHMISWKDGTIAPGKLPFAHKDEGLR